MVSLTAKRLLIAGVKEGDGADYVVVLLQSDHPVGFCLRSQLAAAAGNLALDTSVFAADKCSALTHMSLLQLNAPPFPPFVRQLIKDGECYSLGAFGWMLNSGQIDVKKYSYFVVVDASVRGPFIAPYVPVSNAVLRSHFALQALLPDLSQTESTCKCPVAVQSSIPWHRLLTRRLDQTTKLVGPVISCEGAPFKGNAQNKWRHGPSVQSYAIALDQVGAKTHQGSPESFWQTAARFAGTERENGVFSAQVSGSFCRRR